MLPIAAGDTTNALITAGATLLGVLIGATLGGIIDYRLARRREQSEGRAGARLVQDDLKKCTTTLTWIRRQQAWYAPYGLPTEAWTQYRGVLASVLDRSSWSDAAAAASMLQELLEITRDLQRAADEAGHLPEAHGELSFPHQGFAESRIDEAFPVLLKAYNALAPLAETERLAALSSPPPP
jgi:hypothetical protein